MDHKGFWLGLLGVALLWASPVPAAQLAPPDELLRAREALTDHLNRVDADCAVAAKRLGQAGLIGKGARRILNDLCAARPEAVDCAAVDLKGRMVTVEPAAWRSAEGADISSQEQIIQLQKTRKPVLSRLFKSVEGFDAVDLEYPVFSAQKELIGSVSMLIRPERLLERVLAGTKADIRVIQADGRILFSRDRTEIGKMFSPEAGVRLANRFFSPAAGQKAACSNQGSCGEPESARAEIRLHGTLWQLVMTPGMN